METEVSTDDLCKTLTEVRKLLKECVLPRLDKLEAELFYLRRHTWPICALLNESSPVSEPWFRDKAFSYGGDEYLLMKKNKLSKVIQPSEPWRHDRVREEKILLDKYK
jgi:hypothetical protein